MTAPALVADVGGTHVRFALASGHADSPRIERAQQFAVAEHASLAAAARDYLSAQPDAIPPQAAVLAIAGRVDGDFAEMTNHPWRIHASELAATLDLARVELINDFAAQAWAVTHLAADQRIAIGSAAAPVARRDRSYAVLGPGTGLGVSALLCRGQQSLVLESEGGHAAFAPKTARQRDLLAVLSERYPRVSYERLLSGSGLSNLHWALSRLAGEATPTKLPPEQVTAAAEAGDPRCQEVLQLFVEVFGALAGDLVLTFGAWDGVYLSGGLVPRLLTSLQQGEFRSAFENKGRFSAALAKVPVYAVLHPQAGLLGAAARARSGESAAPTRSAKADEAIA